MKISNHDAARDRARGALVGLAIGDALGAPLEFSARDSLPEVVNMIGGGPFKLKAGQWTDDTSMALGLAESLVDDPGLNPSDCMSRWVKWWLGGAYSCTGHCFDIGGQTSAALRAFTKGKQVLQGPSAGNGGIMRLSPAAIVWVRHPERAVAISVKQSKLTHRNKLCDQAAAKLGSYIARAIQGGESQLEADMPKTLREQPRHEVRSTGFVVDTMEAAYWSMSFQDGFEATLIRAVNLAGDSDTVGAVTGQLAGATWGLSAIPKRWLAKLAWREQIIELADKLYEANP